MQNRQLQFLLLRKSSGEVLNPTSEKTVESIIVSCLTLFCDVCDFLRHWRRRETPASVAIRRDDFDHES